MEDSFGAKPLGVYAISQMLPKNASRPMNPVQKGLLDEKFAQIKRIVCECEGYETSRLDQVITPMTLLKITRIRDKMKDEYE